MPQSNENVMSLALCELAARAYDAALWYYGTESILELDSTAYSRVTLRSVASLGHSESIVPLNKPSKTHSWLSYESIKTSVTSAA